MTLKNRAQASIKQINPAQVGPCARVDGPIVYYQYTEADLLQALTSGPRGTERIPAAPYLQFLQGIRTHLVRAGFVELSAGVVVPEFYNFQLLGIWKDHPDRDSLHTFYLTAGQRCIPVNHVRTLQGTTLRQSQAMLYSPLTLPSHTTGLILEAVMHTRYPKPVFMIGTSFRRQREDATHKIQFDSLQLFIPDCTIQRAYRVLTDLFRACGLTVTIRRTEYPYTEPSWEVYGLREGIQVQLAGGGLFVDHITSLLGYEGCCAGASIGLQRIWQLHEVQ